MVVRITPPAKPQRPAPESASVGEDPVSEIGPKALRSVPPRVEYLAGQVIADRYKLRRPIGRGGMGVVWIAHSLVLDVDVAVKLIHSDLGGPNGATRMAREAHAAARLGHPAMVRVFDFGWTNRGDPFLVMELVQGESLGEMLRRDLRLPAIQAVQTLLPLADGLRSAHDKGIIHRDVKPDNILIARDEFGRQQPKLLDFGIAKVDQSMAATDHKLTQIGVVLGSPEYMSPEQALGREDIDHRTDVWALSVVLYECITGQIPWARPNYNALMQAIIHEPAAPTTQFSAGDIDLWRVIARGLQKDPNERWASMTELGEALALWLYEHGVKEDISANSLRAVWLDGTLSGVRMEVSTLSPRGLRSVEPIGSSTREAFPSENGGRLKATERPGLDPTTEPAPPTSKGQPISAAVASVDPLVASSEPAGITRSRWLVPALVAVALGLGLCAGLLLRDSRPVAPEAVKVPVAASPAAASPAPALVATPPSSSALIETTKPKASAVVAAADSSKSAPRIVTSSTRAPAPPPPPAAAAPAARPRAAGKSYDFGF